MSGGLLACTAERPCSLVLLCDALRTHKRDLLPHKRGLLPHKRGLLILKRAAPCASLQTANLQSTRGIDGEVTCGACCRGLKQVAHLKIAPALEAHKHRREAEKNKDAIVTMIMRPSEPAERQAIYPEQDLIVAVSPDNHRLVHYQSMTSKGLAMDIIGPDNAHRFDVHPNIQVRFVFVRGLFFLCTRLTCTRISRSCPTCGTPRGSRGRSRRV